MLAGSRTAAMRTVPQSPQGLSPRAHEASRSPALALSKVADRRPIKVNSGEWVRPDWRIGA